MMKFTVNYRMVCNGTVEVEASSQEEANRLAENMPASALAAEADDVETEIVSEGE